MTTDIKEAQKDSLPKEGQIPSVPKEFPSGQQKVFTKEEVDKAFADRQSKFETRIQAAEKQLASERQAREAVEAKVKATEARQVEQERRDWEAKIKAAEGDPDLLDSLNRERRLAEREAAVDEADAARAERDAVNNEIKRREYAKEYAEEFGIDVNTLLDSENADLTDTPEKMKKFAKGLARVFGKPKEEVKPEAKTSIIPDSGIGAGMGMDLRSMTPDQKIRYGIENPKK